MNRPWAAKHGVHPPSARWVAFWLLRVLSWTLAGCADGEF